METQTPNPNHVGLARIQGGFSLIATETIQPDERILRFEGELRTRPSRYSVQVGERQHIDLPADVDPERHLDRALWRFLNHSCNANARICGQELFALRAIRPLEEITFDYNTTEYEIAFPFPCHCSTCDGREVRGFKHVSTSDRARLLPRLADHLRRHLVEGAAQTGE